MQDSPRSPSFWQTLPGVITAITGLITAVGGLIIAVDQYRGRTGRTAETAQSSSPPPASTASGVTASGPSSSPTASSGVRAATRSLTVGPPTEVAVLSGGVAFAVLSARLEPFNQETRRLNITLRITNNMKNFDRTYYSELRAIADGLPQAPEDAPLEQIEAHSVKDVTYTFQVPAAARTLALRISRMDETGDIPLH